MEIDPENLEGFFEFVLPHLDEKQRRLVSGAMARLLGHGCCRTGPIGMGASFPVSMWGPDDGTTEAGGRQREGRE